jgi:hypothetical protein
MKTKYSVEWEVLSPLSLVRRICPKNSLIKSNMALSLYSRQLDMNLPNVLRQFKLKLMLMDDTQR